MKSATATRTSSKRNFKITSEPTGRQGFRGHLWFVIQKHAASAPALHFGSSSTAR
jgi:hypothetical protein